MTAAPTVGRPGMVLGGRYALESYLGSGAMGDVWRARHNSIGTPYAVKVVSSQQRGSEATLRLLTEARAAATIVSPYVVRVFDHGEEQGVAYIAMELLQGETLAARIEREGKLDPRKIATIVQEIARGLTTVHEHRTVHRDLKPENVYLTRTPDGEVAKLVDFGVAKSLTDPASLSTHQGVVVGTPAYLSPEQVMGGQPLDARADLWALAILAFECLTGRLPYEAPSMAGLFAQIVGRGAEKAASSPDLPPSFALWFRKATHPDPTQRFASPLELSDALTRALAPDLAGADTTSENELPAGLSGRAIVVLSALAGLSLVLVVLVVRAWLLSSKPAPALAASAEAMPSASVSAAPGAASALEPTPSPFLPRPRSSGSAAASPVSSATAAPTASDPGPPQPPSSTVRAPAALPPKRKDWGF